MELPPGNPHAREVSAFGAALVYKDGRTIAETACSGGGGPSWLSIKALISPSRSLGQGAVASQRAPSHAPTACTDTPISSLITNNEGRGQPLDVNDNPGSRNATHIPEDFTGPLPAWPR